MNPARFAGGVAQALSRIAAVHEHTAVSGIRATGGRHEVITTNGDRVMTDHVVLATSGWSLTRGMRSLAVPFTSYIAVTEPVPPQVTERLGDSLFWDTYEIYHYLRRLPDGRVLIGGNDSILSTFGLSTVNQAATRLFRVLRRYFPGADLRLQAAWAGRIALPADGLPVIETRGDRTLLITDGLALGWLLGSLAAERIGGKPAELDALFDADRDMGFAANLLRKAPLPRAAKLAAMRIGLGWELLRSALDEKFFR
jgi:glycine/D-amino acid oxidase-like deaminating enzyme